MSKLFNSKEFKELQQKWYQKLESEGFSDIEVYKNKAGTYYPNPYPNQDVKNLYTIRKNLDTSENFELYREQTFLYYSGCRAFLAHYSSPLPFLDHKILKLHAEGLSIRKIQKALESFVCKYPPIRRSSGLRKYYSKCFVHLRLKEIKKLVDTWNATSPHGVRYSDYGDLDD